MTAEIAPQNATLDTSVKKSALFSYPACGGKEGSSDVNWVPVDFVSYQIARLFHITDEDIKKKNEV